MKTSTLLLLLICYSSSLISQNLAIKNATIIPMDQEQVLENQTLIITDGIITKIGNSDDVVISSDIKIIEAKGRFLMPGIADMHVHLRNEDELVNYLAYGVTTVMHLGGSSNQGKENLRYNNEIDKGTLIGPNIYTTKRILDGDPPASGGAYRIKTPERAIELVNNLKNEGYDFIKIYNNIPLTAFNAIVKESERVGLPLLGHLPRKYDALHAINNGQDMIVHTEELFFTYFKGPRSTSTYDKEFQLDVSLIPDLITSIKKNNVAIIPNLSFAFTDFIMWDDVDVLFADSEIKYVAPNLIRNEFISGNINRRSNIENFIHRDQQKYELSLDLTYKFQKAGILQLLGTDATQAGLFPGKSVHRELTELVKAGLTNYEVLSIATKNAGQFAEAHNLRDSNFGQIKLGFIADMILLEKNPLDDIRNTKRIDGVITNGKWISMEEIDGLRSKIAAKYAALKNIELLLKESLLDNTTEAKMKQLITDNHDNEALLTSIESNINSLGYNYVSNNELVKAIAIFKLNTKYFENSGNVWDSYAEAHLLNNDRVNAIKYYTKALEVNPELSSAKEQLKKLKKE